MLCGCELLGLFLAVIAPWRSDALAVEMEEVVLTGPNVWLVVGWSREVGWAGEELWTWWQVTGSVWVRLGWCPWS